eukprot:656033-Prymnesium_polylepis.1
MDNRTLTLNSVTHKTDGFIMIKAEWGGQEVEIANVYAPSSNENGARAKFFKDTLQPNLNADTFVGGDWNCVPDVTLDVESANPLNYPNGGAAELATIMGSFSLIDERREQLGEEREVTRRGVTANGVTGTRIDRWYGPTSGRWSDILWTFQTHNTFVFKKNASDHYGVALYLENQSGDLGHDRKTVLEDILLDREVQMETLRLLQAAYKGNKSNKNKWRKALNTIRQYLLVETARRRKKDKIELVKRKRLLEIVKRKLKIEATPRRLAYEQKLQQDIYHLKHPETRELPSDVSAYNMYERAEISSKAQFSTYKTQARRQWINEIKVAEWKEGVDPDFLVQEGPLPRNINKTTDTAQVGHEFEKYFKMLFEEKVTDDGCARLLLRKLARKKILEPSKQKLEARITVQEVAEVMENLPTGKQAGPNRVPNAVFRYMSAHFAPKLTDVLNDIIGDNALPQHFLEGDIAMLYKKGPRDD